MNRSIVTSSVLASLVVLSSSALGGNPAFAAAADSPAVENVVVSGTGQVSGKPDTLTAAFAVETNASTVAQAMDSTNVAAGRMHDALVHAGVATADLQTSDINVTSKVNDAQAITGYSVSEGLTAKIRNLPHAGALMSAAITAGGNAARLNGVSFSIEKKAALLTEARKDAFADARQKAVLYAGEAGRPLGRVLNVTETGSDGGGHGVFFSPGAMDSRFPIEPGLQQLSVTVSVEWALDPPPKR